MEVARFVLLGASNLSNLLPRMVGRIRAAVGGPVDVFAVRGYGRSLGKPSRFFARGLDAMLDCGVWDALDASPARGGTALLMDVGNDILYGFDDATIAGWVDVLLERLARHCDHLHLAGMPGTFENVSVFRYGIVRTFFVPGCKVERAAGIELARRLEERLPQVAAAHGARFVALPERWYGTDPVHIRRGARTEACDTLLELPPGPVDRSTGFWQIRSARPQRYRLFVRELRASQPAVEWADGSRLSLF